MHRRIKIGLKPWVLLLTGLSLGLTAPLAGAEAEARALVKAVLDHWRDESSYAVAEMIIHRPDWERRMQMRIWTRGDKETLVRVIAPKKDAGNSTLLKDREMWSFSPKISRVIKIPSSMMGQSWLGSDFSNNDIARADKMLEDYTHRIIGREEVEGHRVTLVESVPLEQAAVVWGKEVVKIRDDYLPLEHAFYDQDGVLVKRMLTLEIKLMGGKPVATVQRMQQMENPEEWTELRVSEAEFKLDLADALFTLANLRNPRE